MISQLQGRPTYTIIDLDALAFNFHSAKSFIGSDVRYLAVVKADAYGHGAAECALRLESEGVDWFGVALPEEGCELREAGIKKQILCLGGFWPGQQETIIVNNITPAISRIEQAELLNAAAARRNIIVDIHIKIDTGMGRVGVRQDEVAAFADRLKPLTNLRLEGLMTHFAAADDLSENGFTEGQIAKFAQAVGLFRERGFTPDLVDLANSPAAVAHPAARQDLVRLGGILYGLGGDVLPKGISAPELKPVLSLRTQISHKKNVPVGETLGYGRSFKTKRDSVIATIPIGYADGFPRGLSNLGKVIVNASFAPIVGRVSMDWTIIDVTDIAGVEIGSEVILIGSSNDRSILAEDLAGQSRTISYEITCGINDRVARRFVGTD